MTHFSLKHLLWKMFFLGRYTGKEVHGYQIFYVPEHEVLQTLHPEQLQILKDTLSEIIDNIKMGQIQSEDPLYKAMNQEALVELINCGKYTVEEIIDAMVEFHYNKLE